MNVTAISGGNPSFNGLMNFRNAKKLINSQLLDVYDVSIESKKVVSIDGISDRVLNALNNVCQSNNLKQRIYDNREQMDEIAEDEYEDDKKTLITTENGTYVVPIPSYVIKSLKMRADKYDDCYVNKTDTVHPSNANTKLLKFSIYSPWNSESVLGTQNNKFPDNVF